MKYTFQAAGHPNIRATHKNTLEITKHAGLTEKGDCIVVVHADFDLAKVKQFLSFEKIKVTIATGNMSFSFDTLINPAFDDNDELVFRRGDFASKRTLGVRADKACNDIPREFVELLKAQKQVVVTLEAVE